MSANASWGLVASFATLATASAAHADPPLDLVTTSSVGTSSIAHDAVSDEELRLIRGSLGAPPAPPAPEPPNAVTAAIQSLNPDLAVILDVAFAWFSADDPQQLGEHDPNRNGFNFQQLELHLGASVDPYFRVDANLVFTGEGVELEEAYASTLALPLGLQIRAGQFLTRIGKANATHPHAWWFADRAIVLGKMLGADGSRGPGFELSWLAPAPWYLELVASANEAEGECCARSFLGDTSRPVRGPEDFLYTLAAKQFFDLSDDWGLGFGLSSQLGPNAEGPNLRTAIYAADLNVRWRPIASAQRTAVTLQAESLLRTREIPGEELTDLGAYAQLVWTITPRWETGARYEWVGGVQNDPLDPEWNSARQRASWQVTFYPSHFSRIRLQGSLDDLPTTNRIEGAVILAFEVLAGAHGAHQL